MSHITRAELSRDTGARKALTALLRDQGGTDGGHRLVWTLFADDPKASRDFVFREAEPGRYLIVSARPPGDGQGLWRLETKPYAPAFREGQRFGFTLRANPATAVKQAGETRGKRVDAIMHAKTRSATPLTVEDRERVALDWLLDRQQGFGVLFERALCSAGGYRQVRVPRGGKAITFSVIDYEGVFTVRDPGLLGQALVRGIGKAKAYGCGLMLLRRLAE
ncbi:type I-E CRISPR-associated protein Cas6/Cse3/CasE [Rhodospirillum rubrum]|uniref:CRISPR-associated protein, CT1974 n=1 Tax=Rhodospirillum rubrum (strain ATCC 11170 / ATH 1.1.1 / DSM 467 / LMG 4362 / NCIMB 8255 / S1) TaxID=269796 RepID=Q2RY20_RHORT|nr:type I-E CRISPR-associated protein Cas6/Cse3/CasE [Rhodospirillum rubrum]ABC20975.1 CRISPR-associated protein, CT1974 [Rhodospirillum rubrum ATCC 11170]AEO46640.1 CRISPR-associated Cse3 family protein [Rhodospirillum rubrum F11]MBK5952529.1 type I-E CRISPR-associated protein Cas6/Cse3/CasE [Rhodospirillum rubrum]QXG80672.1 type I-E CRISPR-associated protein Cas6/Cse3/CasE [Rhodospirillum rubrum]HCF17935.1 type I-E CRISPR-associated protein Cas6/Cse3/CasE [Rhodospirillum rubrum]